MASKKKRGAPIGNKNAVGNKGGAPIGNRNAIGNKGGGAPYGNKNAEKHGLYSRTYWRNVSIAIKLIDYLEERDRLDEFDYHFFNMTGIIPKQTQHKGGEK